MNNQPLVTVCIATFKREKFLPNAINSVLNQTYQNIETIIVDDCSPDATQEVVKEYLKKDHRIRYIRHDINKGLAAARNTAIFNAKGTYFTFVDDDDSWDKSFIAEFVNLASGYDENWCFCCGYRYTGKLGKIAYNSLPLDGKLLEYCKQGYAPPVASQFYFTSKVKQVGGYNENIKTGVDHDLWLRLAFHDVNIKSLHKHLAFLGSDTSKKREQMTKQYEKRINGIQKSLDIWKEDIIEHCGQEFYYSFHKSYLLREKKELLRYSLFNLDIKQSFKIYRDIKNYVSIKEVMHNLISAIAFYLGIKFHKEQFSIVGPTIQIVK